MDISPDALCEPVIRTEKVEDEINLLVHKIQNSLDNHKEEFDVIVGDGGFTSAELDHICNKFIFAGWEDVTATSSADLGERPGLMRYRFVK